MFILLLGHFWIFLVSALGTNMFTRRSLTRHQAPGNAYGASL